MAESITHNNRVLEGIKVIDLTRAVAGPYCTMVLGDMGAEVIKVETPGVEKEDPKNKPPSADAVALLDRNKKSITLNLRTDKGKKILRQLIEWADVLVENYRPGVMRKMGFDYPNIKKINPRLVMTSISGYGQTGPYASRAGLDGIGQAMGGFMTAAGPAGVPPIVVGTPIADISTGLYAAFGTLSALYHVKSTGKGQVVESSLMESTASLINFSLSKWSVGLPPEGTDLKKDMPGAGVYQSGDGNFIMLMGQLPNHFASLANLIGRGEFATAPGYANRRDRTDHADEISDAIQAWIGSRKIDEVEAALDNIGIPFGRVQSVEEVMTDPHLTARGRFGEVGLRGEMKKVFGPYPVLSETPLTIHSNIPTPGQHNDDVYQEILGISREEMITLKDDGVI